MKQFFIKYALLFYLYVTILYLEFFLLINTIEPVNLKGILVTSLFSLSYAIILFLIISLLPKKTRGVAGGFIIIFICLLFSSQLVYYKLFKTFFTVFSAAKGGMVLEFISDIVHYVGSNIHWIIIMFMPFILFQFLIKGLRIKTDKFSTFSRLLCAFLAAAIFLLALLPINLGEKRINSPYDYYYKTFLPNNSVNNFGLLTSMRIDFQRTVLSMQPENRMPQIIISPTPSPSATPSLSPDQDKPITPTIDPVILNILGIDFMELAENETNPTIRNMHQYFGNARPTAQNKYTGMFEGYNLIFITAESYSHYAIDEFITPTLYKMTHEGFNFKNFYNPIWGVSTSDGEYVATTGLLPKSSVWSMYLSSQNYMPFAMGNQLKELGYDTRAYHNHTYNYYRRDLSHPNLGYVYKGIGNGLDMPYTWPSSDLDMMEATFDEYSDNIPFHAYYMTVSGHMRYNFAGNFIAAKNRALVEDLNLSAGAKAYMATQIELDKALEYLLEQLEKEGIADNTLIVLSSDHYPYGLEYSQIEELAGKSVDNNFELYKSSLIIYSPSMEPEVIDGACSSLDIIPTISNLMGIPYDSRLLMGTDIFSSREPLVIFLNRSFITEKGRYNAQKDIFIPNPSATFDEYESMDEYVDEMLEKIERKFYYSEQILDNDYYNVLNLRKE